MKKKLCLLIVFTFLLKGQSPYKHMTFIFKSEKDINHFMKKYYETMPPHLFSFVPSYTALPPLTFNPMPMLKWNIPNLRKFEVEQNLEKNILKLIKNGTILMILDN